MPDPRLVSVLTENWTMMDPRDLRGIVRMAQEAEDAGFDMVMVRDHVLLEPSAGSAGRMANPRDYAMPGNQDPRSPWPSSVVLLSTIAAATTRIRHRDEYEALGVDFTKRGRMLDEQLAIWSQVWAHSPPTHHGDFYSFTDAYLEPKPWRPGGPAMWFGGERVHGKVVERFVRYGSGFHPVGRVDPEDVATLRSALADSDRSTDEFELVGGTRVDFPSDDSVAPLAEALEEIPRQQELGFTTFCIEPSIFIDRREEHTRFCHEVVARVAAMAS